jgi:hypothetical protein
MFVGSLFLYASFAWLLALKRASHPYLVGSVMALAVAAAVAFGLGWGGATWNAWSSFVKTSALIGAFAIPLGVAAATSYLVPLSRFSARLLLGVIVGVATSVFVPLLWLGVVCSATGDCL